MYRQDKVLKTGGGHESGPNTSDDAKRVFVLEGATDENAGWTEYDPLIHGRKDLNLTLMPDGRVFVVGGADPETLDPVQTPEIYDPTGGGQSFAMSAPSEGSHPRQYHAVSLLLPDGRLFVAGGEDTSTRYKSAQLFRPPYLFDDSDNPAPRPVIDAVQTPGLIGYGESFKVLLSSEDAAEISQVNLLALGACTHSFDQNQRVVSLSFQPAEADELSVVAPAHAYLAPPGYYMLFVLKPSNDGRNLLYPSVAKIVKLAPQ